jgi:hypothetical protein
VAAIGPGEHQIRPGAAEIATEQKLRIRDGNRLGER